MFNYRKATTAVLTAALLGMAPSSFAETPAESNSLGIEAWNLSSLVYTDDNGDADSQSYAGMTLRITDQFKANFAASLEEAFDGLEDGSDFDIEKFVAQAEGVITINKQNGDPILFVFGKLLDHDMKAELAAAAKTNQFSIQGDTEVEEVLGFYVELSPSVLDSLQVAVTETEGGDFEIGDEIRITAQGHKVLSEIVEIHGSLSYETDSSSGPDAAAVSVGILVDLDHVTGTDGLSGFFQVTGSQDGYGDAQGNRIGIDTGINWERDNYVVTGGLEYVEDDFVEELMPYVGAEFQVKDGVSLYGRLGYMTEAEEEKLEAGISFKW